MLDAPDDLRRRLDDALASVGDVSSADLAARLASRKAVRRRRAVTARVIGVAAVVVFMVAVASVLALRRTTVDRVGTEPNPTSPGTYGWEPGWHEVDPGPLATGSVAATTWTGHELVFLFGGSSTRFPMPDGLPAAAFDPSSRSWRTLASNPLPPGDLRAVWTGREIVEVSAPADHVRLPNSAAAWDRATNAWRLLPTPPPIVATGLDGIYWTGREVLVPSRLARFDPQANTWAAMAPPPTVAVGRSFYGAWTGAELVLAATAATSATIAYDPIADQWKTLAPSPSLQTASATFARDQLVLYGSVDSPRSIAYDIRGDSWAESDQQDFPIARCPGGATTVGNSAVLHWCSAITFLDQRGTWVDVGLPGDLSPPGDYVGSITGTETVLFGVRGTKFDVFVPEPDLIGPAPEAAPPSSRAPLPASVGRSWPTARIGAATLDVPTDFSITGSGPVGQDPSLAINVPQPEAPWPAEQPCTITAVPHANEDALRTFDGLRQRTTSPDVRTVNVEYGVAAGFFLNKGDVDDREHVIVDAGADGMVDVGCDRLLVARELAQYLH